MIFHARCRRAVFVALATLAIAPIAPVAHADDASTGVPFPELRARPQRPQVVSARVLLHGHHVAIDLQTRSPMPAVATTLRWRSERVRWMGEGETYPDRQFPELKWLVDGAPMRASDRTEAFIRDRDVSSLLATAGLDPWVITGTPPFVDEPASANAPASRAWAELVRDGAIERQADGDWARWTAQRSIDIPLPARREHRIQLSYDTRPAFELITVAQLEAAPIRARYCLSSEGIAKLRERAGNDLAIAAERLAIPTGLDGAPPRKLTVTGTRAPAPEAAASLPASMQRETVYFWCAQGHGVAMKDTLGDVDIDARGVIHILRLAVPTTPAH